jgi:hypothetical protein
LTASQNAGYAGAYTLYVKYEFAGSPHPDFTTKIYSKYTGVNILDTAGNSNMIHMDGTSPSGYTSSSYIGMSNWDCSMGSSTDSGGDSSGGDGGDGGTTTEERNIETMEVKSLLDVFNNAQDIGEFFALIWYNPGTMFIWFHFW